MSESENQETAEPRSRRLSAPVAPTPSRRLNQGPVMPIGGAEEKNGPVDDNGRSSILARFVDLAGGKSAHILVVPTASETPEERGEQYVKVFGKLGAKSVNVLRIAKREDASSPEALQHINDASGIFITGGDQARLIKLLVGTASMEAIRLRNADGIVVAGTSAGASIIPSHLMSGENVLPVDSSDTAARKGLVQLAAGLGLLQDIIVDQHFSQRGRLGRLLTVFAANPGLLGIGLDEDTAVLITKEGVLEVLGTGMVTMVDGREAVSDYYDVDVGDVLTVVNSHLFVFGPGRCFDLDTRQPIPWESKT